MGAPSNPTQSEIADLAGIVEAKRREIERWRGVDMSLTRMAAAVACPRDGHRWWTVMGVRVCGRCGVTR
jgi:hypothetical protein